jgi:hypothetical protein
MSLNPASIAGRQVVNGGWRSISDSRKLFVVIAIPNHCPSGGVQPGPTCLESVSIELINRGDNAQAEACRAKEIALKPAAYTGNASRALFDVSFMRR